VGVGSGVGGSGVSVGGRVATGAARVGVSVGVGVKTGVGVSVGIGVEVGVAVWVGIEVEVGVAVWVGVALGVGVSVGIGVAVSTKGNIAIAPRAPWSRICWRGLRRSPGRAPSSLKVEAKALIMREGSMIPHNQTMAIQKASSLNFAPRVRLANQTERLWL
jgi:hypothetical protein